MADQNDPKELILESYRIEGITESECRSIFLDWALSVGIDSQVAISGLLETYGADHPDHPMTAILKDGLAKLSEPRRRGGWRSRER